MNDMGLAAVRTAVPPQAAAEGTASSRPPGEREEEGKTLIEMMQEAREKAEAGRDSFQLKRNGSEYGDATMTAYSKLARARSHAEVNAAAGYARRRIAQFQAALSSDSDNADRIRAAIRQLQKAVGRARKKGRDLDREKLLEVRRRRAQQEKARRKAAHLGQELNRKQTMRMIRESGYLREAEIDNRLQDQLAQTKLELRLQAEKLSASLEPSVGAAMQQYAAQSAPAASAPAPAEIDIQV